MRNFILIAMSAMALSACGLTENGRELERVYTKADADVCHDCNGSAFSNGPFYYRYADKK